MNLNETVDEFYTIYRSKFSLALMYNKPLSNKFIKNYQKFKFEFPVVL